MNKTMVTALVVAVVVGGGGFYAGMTYAKGQAQSARAQFTGGAGGFAGRGAGGARGGGVFGTVIGKDASSITVQLMSGPNATSMGQTGTGTKIVFYNDSTQVQKTVAGSAADISVGTSVVVGGTPNSDGSVTAQSIQIRPAATGARSGQ